MNDLLKIASYQSFKTLDNSDDEFIYIAGMASTVDKDRDGEIVSIGGMNIENYKKNPIILFSHDRTQPVGKVVDIEKRENGLWIKAAVSKTADKIVSLIKQGILKTFSIGFSVKDYDFSDALNAWILKETELFETSIVAVPANGAAIFEQVKSYGETHNFKKPSTNNVPNKKIKEIDMTLEEMQAKMKEMEDNLKAEKAEKVRLLKEKEQKELEEKMAKEKAEKEALKTEIKGVEEKVSKVTELIESITDSVKSLTEEIETLKTSKPRIEGAELDQKTIDHFMPKYKDVLVASMLFKKNFKDTLAFDSLPERAKAVSLSNSFTSQVQDIMLDDIKAKSAVYPLFREIPSQVTTDTLPFSGTMTKQWGSLSSATYTPGEVSFAYYSLFAGTTYNYVTDEEAVITWLPVLREDITEALSEGVDAAIVDDDGTHTNTFAGVAAYANAASYTETVATDGIVTADDVGDARANMGKYGVKPTELVFLCNSTAYLKLVQDSNVLTVDKYGAKATILTGELGKVNGVPIVVNDDVPYDSSSSGAVVGVLLNKRMFLTKMKSFMVEFDKTITNQTATIVGSVRAGFIPSKPLSTGQITAPFCYNLVNAV